MKKLMKNSGNFRSTHEFNEQIRSKFADIKNIGGRAGGTNYSGNLPFQLCKRNSLDTS